jgi:hypothetical protein
MKTLTATLPLDAITITLRVELEYLPKQGVYISLWEAFDTTGLANRPKDFSKLRNADLNLLPADELLAVAEALQELSTEGEGLEDELRQEWMEGLNYRE